MVDLGKSVVSAAQQLRVRSALNPMLWLTGIVSPLCLAVAYAFRDTQTISWVLIFAAIIPIVVTCLGFAYFAITKPEKLQSEEYQLRHETLQIIQRTHLRPIFAQRSRTETYPASIGGFVRSAGTS